MPRRKKLPQVPDYKGLGRNHENMIVQKSNPLQSLSETGMSLSEFKILDAYLSRIDSHKPEARYIRFEKGELEKLLGVTKILQSDLEARLDGLFRTVTIKDNHKSKGFTKIALFEKAEANQDENGLWQVDLACTPSAMEYIFNIDTMGYLPYMLKNVIELTSRYSYILYLYLENNRFRKCWCISLEELKKMLRCTADTYSQYYRFNDLILKKCHKELNEKTSIKYNYEPVKSGRKVTEIRFTLETQSDEDESDEIVEGQLYIDDLESSANEETNVEYVGKLAYILGYEVCDNEFTPKQVRVLQDLLLQVFSEDAAMYVFDEKKLSNYLMRKIHKMNTYNVKKESRFNYLCKMIQGDIKE